MLRVIRVKYEEGVLKPLEPLELREGAELRVVLLAPIKDRRQIIERYKGFMGEATKEEIDQLLLEAEFEDF